MSGPKISVYSLTGRAREIVMEQINCEQRSLACSAQIKLLLSACTDKGSELDKSLGMLEFLQKRDGGKERMIEEVQYVRSSMNLDLERLKKELHHNMPGVSSKYVISEKALEEKKGNLEKLLTLKNEVQTLKDSIFKALDIGKGEQRKVQQTITEYLTDDNREKPGALEGRDLSALETSISEDISGVLSFDTVDVPKEDTGFDNRKKTIHNELTRLSKLDLPKELHTEIRNALRNLDRITQMSDLSAFDSISVKKIFRDIEDYQREREKKRMVFEEAQIRYRMLSEMAGKADEQDHIFADADELEEAITELEKIVVKQKEQIYIADCVDEVMKDMGYDLIGRREVRKRSGRQFKNELFQFGEGTAVNITYSPEGQISMELGGLARDDRLPTADETDVLMQDMEAFCGEFAEFEKRMKEKGIIVGNRIALSPPSAEYAAIINVNDYTLESGKQITEMKAEGKRKKTAAGKQVLRKGEL